MIPTTFPCKYPVPVTALTAITGSQVTTQTKNAPYFYDYALLLCWLTEQISVENKSCNKQCLKSSCKVQLRKSLNYQLWQLGGDPKGQFAQKNSASYSLLLLLSETGCRIMDCRSDSVIVTFLFLLMIAHLGANGIQININRQAWRSRNIHQWRRCSIQVLTITSHWGQRIA